MAKKVTKKRKTKKKPFGIILVLVVLALIVAGYYYTTESRKCQIIKADYQLMVDDFNRISDTVESDITLFESGSKYIEIEWSSSNTKYLSNLGKVTKPISEDTGDVKVTLTLKMKYIGISGLDSFLLKNKIDKLEFTKEIVIKSRPLTDLEKIQRYLDKVYIPEVVYQSMELPNTIGEALATWTSSNTGVLTNTGTIASEGNTKLTLELTINTVSYSKEFNVETKLNDLSYNVEYNFSEYSKTSYANELGFNGLVISNGISNNDAIKFRLDDDLAYIRTDEIDYYKNISFDYSYNGDVTTFSKDTRIALLFSSDGENYTLLKEEVLVDNSNHTFNYDFTSNNYGYIKILVDTDYSNGSRFVNISNLKLGKKIGGNDIKDEVIKLIPKKIQKDNLNSLPFTTPYGGIVRYTLLNEITDDSIEANYKVTIVGFGDDITFEVIIKFASGSVVDPVEVRFIDLSKYGGYNDCGESTYIKFGDYDVLIDAGDDYQTTVKAVEEVINTYSNDKVIDLLIATHPDSDHIGGMDEIINDFKILSAIRFSNGATTVVYNKFNDALNDENCSICTGLDSYNNANGCTRRIDISSDGEVYIEILNTTFYEAKENNARSVVCVLNAYGTRILFTGDADNNGQELEKAYQATVGDIDILKVVHHGTKNGTTLDFLKAVDPEVAIICNGNYLGNKHGHPTYEAIQNLYTYDANMLVYAITGGDADDCELTSSYKCNVTDYNHDRNGMITITIDNNGYNITSELNGDNLIQIKDTDYYKTRSSLEK